MQLLSLLFRHPQVSGACNLPLDRSHASVPMLVLVHAKEHAAIEVLKHFVDITAQPFTVASQSLDT